MMWHAWHDDGRYVTVTAANSWRALMEAMELMGEEDDGKIAVEQV